MLSRSTSAPIQSHLTRPSVNPLYSKCKILKFADNIKLLNVLFAHDGIKSNLPTSFYDSITINIPILQKSRSKSGNYLYYLYPPPPPPIYSLLLSSVFSRQQGLLGGAEAFFLSSNQKLISTEISDKQTSQAEAEFVTCCKISQ